jgi:hypothetical protein
MPASAAPGNVGSLAVAGTLIFNTSPGESLAGACVWDTNFSLSLTGVATDVQLPASEYTGAVTIGGFGVDICASYDGCCIAPGFSYTLTSTGPVGEMSCSGNESPIVVGSFWLWSGGGSCTVANESVPNVSLSGLTESVPTAITTAGDVTSLAMTGALKLCAPTGSTGC